MSDVYSLSIPYFELIHVVVILVRVSAALLFAPIWGYGGLPPYLRIILVFSISLGISGVTPIDQAAYMNPGTLLPAEFLIGLLLSFGARVAFAGLHMGGQLISFHMGFSAVQAIDPTTMNRSTLMSSFLAMFGYVIMLATDQHHLIVRALADSYSVLPLGSVVGPDQWFDSVFNLAGQIFVIGWKIALPVFIATLLVELAIAVVARIQPQINTMVVSAPLKLLVGIVVLGASLVFIPRAIEDVWRAVVISR